MDSPTMQFSKELEEVLTAARNKPNHFALYLCSLIDRSTLKSELDYICQVFNHFQLVF